MSTINTNQSSSASSHTYPSDLETANQADRDRDAVNDSDSTEVDAFQQTQSEQSQSEQSSSVETMSAGGGAISIAQMVLGVLMGTAIAEMIRWLRGTANSLTEEDLRRIAEVVGQEMDEQALEEYTALTDSIKTQWSQYNPYQSDADGALTLLNRDLSNLRELLERTGLAGIGAYQTVCQLQLAVNAERLRRDLEANADNPAAQESLKQTYIDSTRALLAEMGAHISAMRQEWITQECAPGGDAYNWVVANNPDCPRVAGFDKEGDERQRAEWFASPEGQAALMEYIAAHESEVIVPHIIMHIDQLRIEMEARGAAT